MKKQKSLDSYNIKFIDIIESKPEFTYQIKTDKDEKNKEFLQSIEQVFDNIDMTESFYHEQPKLVKKVRFSSTISIINQSDCEYDNVSQDMLSQSDENLSSNSFKSKLINKFVNMKKKISKINNRQNKMNKYKKQLLIHNNKNLNDNFSFIDNNSSQNDLKFYVTSL